LDNGAIDAKNTKLVGDHDLALGDMPRSKLATVDEEFLVAKKRYPSQYKQYSELDDDALKKAINSHEKQIKKHEEFINDPLSD
jgi:hypothetical protein